MNIPFAMRHFGSVRYLKRAPLGVAGLLRASVFVLAIVLLAACNSKAPGTSGGASAKSPGSRSGERPPIDPEVVRQEVEQQESFKQLRKAACPRRIPDRQEERRPFPAINILEGLQYVRISDDSSRGSYEKVIELTDTGHRNLANDLEDEPERYLIRIARREYLPGLERFEKAPGRDDRLVVSFRWHWKPLNALGERLDLRAPYSDRTEHQGRATYMRSGDGWKLDDLWLDSNARDYVRGVYK
jgi:hypothetical protein